jgi:hypothetical protein
MISHSCPHLHHLQYLTTLSSDLMFRFGHMSEWWWRLTWFAPGKAPLLPLDIRCKSKNSDIYIPLDSNTQPSDTCPGALVLQESFDEDKLAASISASVSTAMHSFKNDMEGLIKSQVAAGVAEALSYQNPIQIPVSQYPSTAISSADTLTDLDLPCATHLHITPQVTPSSASNEPMDVIPQLPASSASDKPMDVDSGDISHTLLHYLKQFYHDIAELQFCSAGQQKMVELAFARTQYFVGILPTGGGKSLVFLLPAFAATVNQLPNGKIMKTLVVIPNKALLINTQ